MADKKIPLSIVLRMVDQATSGLKAFNKRLERFTKPIKDFKEQLGDLGEHAELLGLKSVVSGFKGVGGAISDTVGKLLVVGGAAGAAVLGLKSMVDQFDDLGDKAEALGVSVDFLAQLRYAAERSGAEVESLDGGLKTLATGLGQALAGTGRLAAFLGVVSPALLRQVKAAKSNEAAFDLLADAAAKLSDKAKLAAFAQKTLGSADLAPLLARGSKGIAELRQRYTELAGSQEAAAAAAGPVDDAMKDLKAATYGIKAALVGGLSPALRQVVEELRSWFSENRARIAEWATNLGRKLPGAINKLVSSFKGALDTVLPMLEAVGGIKTVAIAVGAVIAGPLVASIYSLGVALLTTPVGWIVAGIAAIAGGAYMLIKHWDAVGEFFGDLWDGIKGIFGGAWAWLKNQFLSFHPLGLIIKHWEPIYDYFAGMWGRVTSVFEQAWGIIKSIVDKVTGAVSAVTSGVGRVLDFLNPFSGDDEGGGGGSGPSAIVERTIADIRARQQAQEARVMVDFANAPRNTRVSVDPRNAFTVDTTVGYQMGLP